MLVLLLSAFPPQTGQGTNVGLRIALSPVLTRGHLRTGLVPEGVCVCVYVCTVCVCMYVAEYVHVYSNRIPSVIHS